MRPNVVISHPERRQLDERSGEPRTAVDNARSPHHGHTFPPGVTADRRHNLAHSRHCSNGALSSPRSGVTRITAPFIWLLANISK